MDKDTSSQFLDDTRFENYSVTGAFGLVQGTNYAVQNGVSYTGAIGFNIDASRSSDAYSGNKLQPAALQTLCCIKF